jgi:hypothetical protein
MTAVEAVESRKGKRERNLRGKSIFGIIEPCQKDL